MSIERAQQKIDQGLKALQQTVEQIGSNLVYLESQGKLRDDVLDVILERVSAPIEQLNTVLNQMKSKVAIIIPGSESKQQQKDSDEESSQRSESGAHSRASKIGRASERERERKS